MGAPWIALTRWDGGGCVIADCSCGYCMRLFSVSETQTVLGRFLFVTILAVSFVLTISNSDGSI